MDTTITITHDGRTVALAGRERFWLVAHIQALPDGHPRRRHVCFMAVYARDVLTGDMPGPYTDSDADHFARLVTNAAGCDLSALASAPGGHGRAATRRGRRRLAPASVSLLPGRRAQNRRWR
jgi:hypothetical protein